MTSKTPDWLMDSLHEAEKEVASWSHAQKVAMRVGEYADKHTEAAIAQRKPKAMNDELGSHKCLNCHKQAQNRYLGCFCDFTCFSRFMIFFFLA